ncbi:MAG: hypothetical protein CVT77_06420 [Alphaproteobacteria bacterium HGW-Alphaproteobacteria-16]|nr:MAG: hypothetical protein CVT77_06420 [Alphaproteobacteria bacterium HGW-Alphaproteobacteria-16]
MNAPVSIMSPVPLREVRDLLTLVTALQQIKRPAGAILNTMKLAGAQVWFANGAFMVRFRGVVGSSTAGGMMLVNSWTRAARRKLGDAA